MQCQLLSTFVSPQPDAISYNTAIHACGRVGEWELAKSLLEEMRDLGLEADVISFGTTVSCLFASFFKFCSSCCSVQVLLILLVKPFVGCF